MATRSQLWPAARITFVGALILFVSTVVVGILNGIDAYTPGHDVLLGHVHAGTIGWITLAVAGSSLLVFTDSRVIPQSEVARARRLAVAMTVAGTVFVAAFFAGDALPGHRIARPITGALLLGVVAWFLAWLAHFQKDVARTVARLGLLLAYASMLIGGLFGTLLGIALSGHRILGLSPGTADAIARAHPASMLIGFLLLAAFSMIEWLLGDSPSIMSRPGVVQMWVLFAAGVLVNVGFAFGIEDLVLGPANAAMIGGGVLLIVRRRHDLAPSAWRGGTRPFSRVALLFLIGYLALLTVIVARFIDGEFDLSAFANVGTLSASNRGLLTAFDHTMFIGVMTNVLFGALAATLHGSVATRTDRILVWGVAVGTAGFVAGLILVEPVLKRIFTPLMGAALLLGIAVYLVEMLSPRTGARPDA